MKKTKATDDASLVCTALDALDSFLGEIPKHPPLHVTTFRPVKKCTASQLRGFEKRTKRPLPVGLQALFTRGMQTATIAGDADYHFGWIAALQLTAIEDRLKWWGAWEEEARNWGETNLRTEERRYGLPIWEEDSPIVVDSRTGAISRCSGEPAPSDAIASSLGELFVHFIGAGCFWYGGADKKHFNTYWKQIESFVPFDIEPKDNLWLQHLDRWYRGNITGPRRKR